MKVRLAAILRAARGPRDAAPAVTVRDAWLAHERYAGHRVALRGVVRAFATGTPGEYFTLDDGDNRIGLRGDPATLREYAGRRVRATGALAFKPGDGIFLLADAVLPVS